MSKRSDASKVVETYGKYFEGYIGKQMSIKFDKFCFPIIIHRIVLAKLGELENKPAPRLDTESGKGYRPPVLEIETNAGKLYFVIEDIDITAITNGLRIDTDTTRVELKVI